MLHVAYTKQFQKQVKLLKPAQMSRIKSAIKQFQADPYSPVLYNHELTGEWSGHRSIAFGGDWRALYKVHSNQAVFVACGTHSQLYK